MEVLFVLCFTRPRYQVSVYRTIGPLVRLGAAWHGIVPMYLDRLDSQQVTHIYILFDYGLYCLLFRHKVI